VIVIADYIARLRPRVVPTAGDDREMDDHGPETTMTGCVFAIVVALVTQRIQCSREGKGRAYHSGSCPGPGSTVNDIGQASRSFYCNPESNGLDRHARGSRHIGWCINYAAPHDGFASVLAAGNAVMMLTGDLLNSCVRRHSEREVKNSHD